MMPPFLFHVPKKPKQQWNCSFSTKDVKTCFNKSDHIAEGLQDRQQSSHGFAIQHLTAVLYDLPINVDASVCLLEALPLNIPDSE